MTRSYRDLTETEHAALEAFAACFGRNKWRATLTDIYWYNARIWEDDKGGKDHGYTLHAIRNEFGPEWLHTVYRPRSERERTEATIRALGLRVSFANGEYRVAPDLGPLPGGRGFQAEYREREEAGAYYTADPADAVATARAMAARLPLVGVWVTHKGADPVRLFQGPNGAGAADHARGMAETYLAIDGNDRAEVREFDGAGAERVLVTLSR